MDSQWLCFLYQGDTHVRKMPIKKQNALPHAFTVMNWWSDPPLTSCTHCSPRLARTFLLVAPKQNPVSSQFHIREAKSVTVHFFQELLDLGKPILHYFRIPSISSSLWKVLRSPFRQWRPPFQEVPPPVSTWNPILKRWWSFLICKKRADDLTNDLSCQTKAQFLTWDNYFLIFRWV